jgi:hypothetical protein
MNKMTKTVSNFLERRKKVKLFQQWVDRAGLPPEEIPPEVLSEQVIKETNLAIDNVTHKPVTNCAAPIDIDGRMVILPFRYVLIGLTITALLLISLAIVSTILVMSFP